MNGIGSEWPGGLTEGVFGDGSQVAGESSFRVTFPPSRAEMEDPAGGQGGVWIETGPGQRRGWTIWRNRTPKRRGPSESGWVEPSTEPRAGLKPLPPSGPQAGVD